MCVCLCLHISFLMSMMCPLLMINCAWNEIHCSRTKCCGEQLMSITIMVNFSTLHQVRSHSYINQDSKVIWAFYESTLCDKLYLPVKLDCAFFIWRFESKVFGLFYFQTPHVTDALIILFFPWCNSTCLTFMHPPTFAYGLLH